MAVTSYEVTEDKTLLIIYTKIKNIYIFVKTW